jgi:protein phosphatase
MYKLFKRSHVPGSFEVQMAGACDTGIARDHNEDAIAIQEDDGCGYYLAIVCDGMGGHNAGELASAMAVNIIAEHVRTHFHQRDVPTIVREAVELANGQIDAQAAENPEASGMGCTTVMVIGTRERAWVAHVGDSRAYRVNGAEMKQITADHTLVQEMVQSGLITEAQAAIHPYRGRISRCIGHGKNRFEPDVTEFRLERDDNVLLCSDGLSDVVEPDEIEKLVRQRDVRSACRRLIEAANKGGGPDNVSALILRRIT